MIFYAKGGSMTLQELMVDYCCLCGHKLESFAEKVTATCDSCAESGSDET